MEANLSKVIKFSVGIAASLIAYFHIMELLGFAHNTHLRVFNGVILFVGIYWYLKSCKDELGDDFEYVSNFINGFGVGLFSCMAFTAYITTYIVFLNPAFFEAIKANEPMGEYITAFSIPLVIFMEGSGSGYIFTLICMQYLKKEKNFKSNSNVSSKGKIKTSTDGYIEAETIN